MNNIHGLSGSRPNNAAGRGGGGAGGDQSPGCLDQIKAGYNSLPLFNKAIMTFCTFLYLISWITTIFSYYMILIPGFLMKF